MKPHADKALIKESRSAVAGLEEDLAGLLWGILRDSPVRSDDLAEAARDDETTVSRMCGKTVRFRVAAIVAAGKLDPESGRKLLAPVASEIGYALVPVAEEEAGCPMEAASEAGEFSADFAALVCRALKDRDLSEEESRELEKMLRPRLLPALERLAARLERRHVQPVPRKRPA